MLDKNHCKVLKFLNTVDIDGCRSTLISIKTKLDVDDVYQILEYLEAHKYVEKTPNCNWRIIYKGKRYKQIRFEQLFQKYWFPIITAIISYVLALITDLLLK